MSRQKLGLELSIGDITILLLKSLYYYLEEFVVCQVFFKMPYIFIVRFISVSLSLCFSLRFFLSRGFTSHLKFLFVWMRHRALCRRILSFLWVILSWQKLNNCEIAIIVTLVFKIVMLRLRSIEICFFTNWLCRLLG